MNIKDYNIILASGSPRRIEMLKKAGASLRIIKPQCEEILHMPLEPQQIVMSLALKKGQWVEEKLTNESDLVQSNDRPSLLIASDTIVYCDRIMGKPKDEDDAFRMLSELKNRPHSVFSGVYLNFIQSGRKQLLFDETRVFVNDFTDDWLRSYIKTGEPMDKAGGYAIQGLFGPMIDHIEGSYDNVVGLPLKRILEQ